MLTFSSVSFTHKAGIHAKVRIHLFVLVYVDAMNNPMTNPVYRQS